MLIIPDGGLCPVPWINKYHLWGSFWQYIFIFFQIISTSRHHISFKPDNWLDFFSQAGLVKFNCTIHWPVVCESQCFETLSFGNLNQWFHFGKTIQKGKMGVDMKVDEVHSGHIIPILRSSVKQERRWRGIFLKINYLSSKITEMKNI